MSDVMQEWRDEERADERIITKLGCINDLMISLGLNLEQAMNALRISGEEREILLKRI